MAQNEVLVGSKQWSKKTH